MKLIIGLGNPGKQYTQTPHNVGFAVVNELTDFLQSSFKKSFRLKARIATASLNNEKLIIAKPQTYMNNSGISVLAIMRYRKISPSDLIVIMDDADIEIGKLRIRPKGSSGGHNGLESIIQNIKTEEFTRIRIGIGHNKKYQTMVNHVLTPFSSDDQQKIQQVIKQAVKVIYCIMESDIDTAMNNFN